MPETREKKSNDSNPNIDVYCNQSSYYKYRKFNSLKNWKYCLLSKNLKTFVNTDIWNLLRNLEPCLINEIKKFGETLNGHNSHIFVHIFENFGWFCKFRYTRSFFLMAFAKINTCQIFAKFIIRKIKYTKKYAQKMLVNSALF